MPRSNRRVFQLARLASLPVDETLLCLRSTGILVSKSNDLIPKERQDQAKAALGIPQEKGLAKYVDELSRTPKTEKPVRRRRARRPLVGHPSPEMIYLSVSDVKRIHWYLVRDFAKSRDPIDPPGLRDQNLLSSALHRVYTSLDEERKYPTVPMAAAAYLHAIIGNHAFHNGNKRTALVSTLVFLDLNSFILQVEQDELFEYLVRIAGHEVVDSTLPIASSDDEMWAIARWIHRNSHPISRQERPLKFHELQAILKEYGCSFEQPKRGNRINIFRHEYRTQVHRRNDGSDIDRNAIRKIRRDLHLMEDDGYDSTIFYNADSRIPDFIQKYRRTLDRLAKV